MMRAYSEESASGNPDWITDLGTDRIDAEGGGAHVSTTGTVHRGFAHSMASILPKLAHCLEAAVDFEDRGAPQNIYVTGHSLGGALALHFTSAVLLGSSYGPDGAGDAMPAGLRGWPWQTLKLITFGAPRSGDEEWAEAMTVDQLESVFFTSEIDPYDRDALDTVDTAIVPRLIDASRPAGYRVLISGDPITTELIGGGKHVGTTVYVDNPDYWNLTSIPDFSDHELTNIRSQMTDILEDERIPETAWRYHDVMEINPECDPGAKGTAPEYEKLGAAVARYYTDRDVPFDAVSFQTDLDLFLSLFDAQ